MGFAQAEQNEDDVKIMVQSLPILVAKKELPYVMSRGAVRIDHADSGWGGGYYVSRIYASSCG